MKILQFKNALLIFGLLTIGLQTISGQHKDHENYTCGNHRISQAQKNVHMAKSFLGKNRFKKKQAGALKRADIKILYAPFKFKGEENPSVTDMEVVKKFYLDNSLGDFSITTTFAPMIELPYTRQEDLNDGNGAGDKDWMRDLVQQLTAKGFDPNNYEYLIRRSHIGEPFMDFNGGVYYGDGLISVSGSYEGLIGHEIGHGVYIATGSRFKILDHANLWKPSNPDQVVGSGSSEEYGNGYSVMGYSPLRHFGLPHKIEMQWLKSTDYHQVTANGTYKIYAHDHGNRQTGRKYGIRIGKKVSPLGTSSPRDYYYVEYKNNFDVGGSENAKNGVLLLTADPDWKTHLFDNTRNTPNGYEDAALEVGKTFVDNVAGITVKTLAKGGSGEASWMDVQITFDDPDGTEELPTVAFVTPNDGQVFSEGASVPVQINASQPGGTVKNVSVSITGVGAPKTDTTAPYEFTWENLAAGSYEITATVTGNTDLTASKTISVQIGENIVLVANAGPDLSLDCSNKEVTLGGTNTSTGEGIAHQWTTADGNIVSGGNSTRAMVDKAGTYTLTVKKNGQSDATDQVVVQSDTTIPTANAGEDVTIDEGNSTQLNGIGGTSYSWSPTTGLSNPNIANPTANPIVSTTYTLSVTGANGCTATDELVVTVNPKEEKSVADAGSDQSIDCITKQVTLGGDTNSNGSGFTYAWTTTDGNIVSGATTVKAIVDKEGTYTLTVSKNGLPDATDQVVVTKDITVPTANAGADMTIAQGESTQLQATGGNTYSWSPSAGLSDSNIANPQANPSVTTTYTLTITGANGCTAIDELVITVKEKELQIVNSFSPNGDGVNDTWKIEGVESYSKVAVTIYNRWGSEVHKAEKNLEWDGNFKGAGLPVGAYYYIVQLDQTVKKGVINLIR